MTKHFHGEKQNKNHKGREKNYQTEVKQNLASKEENRKKRREKKQEKQMANRKIKQDGRYNP